MERVELNNLLNKNISLSEYKAPNKAAGNSSNGF